MDLLIAWLVPILLGAGAWMLSNKVRGRNGQKALRYAALGLWVPLGVRLALSLLFPFWLTWLIGLISIGVGVGFFLAAGNSLIKEMRSQQRGDYTERAM
jgi:hypothetical protein